MTYLRATLTVPALLSSLMLVACGGSSTKGGGGTSGGSGGKSGVGGTSGSVGGTSGGVPKTLACLSSSATLGASCTQAEQDAYSTCLPTACDATLQMCYGPGFKSGQLSGPCGTYEACASKCACSDTACRTACGATPTACSTCLAGLLSCAFSCLPACATAGLGGASGGGLGGSFGGLGGSFGGLGGFLGGLGGGSGSGTCLPDLLACCGRAAAANQTACNLAYQGLAAAGDAFCATSLSTLESTYCP